MGVARGNDQHGHWRMTGYLIGDATEPPPLESGIAVGADDDEIAVFITRGIENVGADMALDDARLDSYSLDEWADADLLEILRGFVTGIGDERQGDLRRFP